MLVVKSVNPAKIDVYSMTNKNFAITAVQGKRAIVNVRSAIKEPFAAIVKNGEIKAVMVEKMQNRQCTERARPSAPKVNSCQENSRSGAASG